MKWNVELPRKFFRLQLQAWDQDLAKVRMCMCMWMPGLLVELSCLFHVISKKRYTIYQFLEPLL
jgi:hypothetical protein